MNTENKPAVKYFEYEIESNKHSINVIAEAIYEG